MGCACAIWNDTVSTLALERKRLSEEASFQEILHPDDRERTFAMVKAHFEERAPFLTEYRLRCGDGSYRWFPEEIQAVRPELEQLEDAIAREVARQRQ